MQLFNAHAVKALAHAVRHRDTLLRPALRLRHVRELSVERLAELRVDGVVLDVDNTLTLPYADGAADGDVVASLAALQGALGRANVALLSNHAGSADDRCGARADALERALGVGVIRHRAKKPATELADAIRRHFDLRLDLARVAFVGDRVLTDVYFANRVGMVAVLVAPLDAALEPWIVRCARRVEQTLLPSER